jgi:hypothetical protein
MSHCSFSAMAGATHLPYFANIGPIAGVPQSRHPRRQPQDILRSARGHHHGPGAVLPGCAGARRESSRLLDSAGGEAPAIPPISQT